MPLTPDEAADIARRHGLTLQDAAGLLTLADDVDHADALAARFAGTADTDAVAGYARALFGRVDPVEEPAPTPTGRDDPHEYVRQLFDPNR